MKKSHFLSAFRDQDSLKKEDVVDYMKSLIQYS